MSSPVSGLSCASSWLEVNVDTIQPDLLSTADTSIASFTAYWRDLTRKFLYDPIPTTTAKLRALVFTSSFAMSAMS